jgi:hypothetical protein
MVVDVFCFSQSEWNAGKGVIVSMVNIPLYQGYDTSVGLLGMTILNL